MKKAYCNNFVWTVVFMCTSFSVLFGQLDLQLQASRTTGVAPLYVFFDATSTVGFVDTNDLVNADFHWNFDLNNTDPHGNWEVVKGMVAGHVFERAGVYEVQCTVTAPDGSTDTETITITVSSFSGTTYYVSASGNDANNGLTDSTAWQTANYAFSQLSPNETILFNRGDIFTNVAHHFQNLTGGKMIIGAYGDGNKPILSGTLDEDRMLELDFIDDIAFMGLHVMVNAPNVGGANFFIENSTDVVLLGLELEGSTSLAVYNDDCDLVGVFDAYVHSFGVLATYAGDGTRMSWVGNRIDSLNGTPQPEHGIRIQGGEKQFIAHNTLTNLTNTKTAITIRGDGQRHVMLYKNKMDRILGVNPQNASTLAAISYVSIEGNYIGQNPDYTGTLWNNTINGINIEATSIAIRNNAIDGYRNAIFVGHDFNGVESGLVDIYHNTVNWRPISPQSGTAGRIVRIRNVDDINIHNNFITAPTIAQGFVLDSSANNQRISVANNIISTPSDYIVNPLPGSEADVNDISNYQIILASTANNAGGSGIPVFYDVDNTVRNDSTPDVGAFEMDIILSVDLLAFEALKLGDDVLLSWRSVDHLNSDFFDIERSQNGRDFEKIGHISVVTKDAGDLEYTFLDENPSSRSNYYRLKRVDIFGKVEYSEVRHVQMNLNRPVVVYPNPTLGVFKVRINDFGSSIRFQLYNVLGARIKDNLIVGEKTIDITELEAGIYYWQLQENGYMIESGELIKVD